MNHHVKKIIFLVVLLLTIPHLSAAEPNISDFKQDASVTYRETHVLHAPPSVVTWLLENPLIIGKLWRIYGYAPKYNVKPASPPDICQVEDPTGIKGNIQRLEQHQTNPIYWAKGEITHWAAPILNEGERLFDVELKPSSASNTQLILSVYIHSKSKIAESALWLLSPVLKSHIDNRITLNLQDLNRILVDIVASPQTVSQKLSDQDKMAFDTFFNLTPAK